MIDAVWPGPAAWQALAAIAALSGLTWFASLVRRDASLVDRLWPVFFMAAAATMFVQARGDGPRPVIALALVVAWGARLCAYLTRRNWGHGEDRRYQALRRQHQPHFGLKSLYLVFALQAALAWLVSWPVAVAIAGTQAPLGALDVAGIALAAFGILYEAIADAQMARFRSDPAQQGKVMDHGLWRTSRHPNYFGECCVWWGLFALALGAAGREAAFTVVSPLVMTGLLLKVSGVALLEKDIGERRPAYRDYIARTPAFIPGRPRATPVGPRTAR